MCVMKRVTIDNRRAARGYFVRLMVTMAGLRFPQIRQRLESGQNSSRLLRRLAAPLSPKSPKTQQFSFQCQLHAFGPCAAFFKMPLRWHPSPNFELEGEAEMRLKTLVTALTAVVVGTLSASAQQTGAVQAFLPGPRTVGNYGHLPMTFEANQGQTSSAVKFLSRGHGYSAFLTTGGMVLNLRTTQPAPVAKTATAPAASQAASTTLQFHLVGANANPAVVGEDLQPGRVNYFLGKNRANWHVNVPTYSKVRYKNVYPGIDLVYYGNHQQLEYDFAVAPGADPGQIQFEIKGASQAAVDEQGNLVLGTQNAQLHFQSPVVYQESNGQRVPVAGGYVMKDASHIGFQLASYNSGSPLVIDPVLVYSSYIGGSGDDEAAGIAVDSTGSVYIAGYTDSANFPLAAIGSLSANNYHTFVAKMDPTGSNLVYADYIGGSGDDYGAALVLDSANNVYVTGNTTSSDFPVVKAYQSQQPGPNSGFLTKVSADGSSLLYSTYLGGNAFDFPLSVAIDSLSEVHVAGYTLSSNFPTVNAYQSSALANQSGASSYYGFLTKFSADGSSLVYSTYFGGNDTALQSCGSSCYPTAVNGISGVALDANGNAYLTGSTNTTNFPTTSGAYQTINTTSQANTLGFASEFSPAGSLQYSTYLYGSSGNSVTPSAIAVDGSGSAYITGTADSDGTFPITSTSICNPTAEGTACGYAFVTKFDPTGSTLLYSTFLGANNYASPLDIVLDANDDAYVLSATSSSSFQLNDAIESFSSGYDLLLVEIDPAATTQLFSTYLGGSGSDYPGGLALDSNGNIYVGGSTESTDLPTTPGVLQNQFGGSTDTFIMKIGPASAPFVTASPTSLQFAAEAVGSTSSTQTVLLRNMGSSALSITSIGVSGDFAEFDNCGSSVAAAGSCTLTISFTPTATGARTGSVTIQDDAAGAPHSIPLSGIGQGGSGTNPAPNAVLMPGTLAFSSVPVTRSGVPQSVTLTNAGNATLTINSLQTSGDFSQTNNCAGTLSAGAACTITVVFNPTAEGTRNGSVTVSDNAAGSPHSVTLTGTGIGAVVTASPSTLAFGNILLGQSSPVQSILLTNTGNATLNLTGVQAAGDFSQTNNCPSTLVVSATCTVNVVFTPTATGSRNSSLTIISATQSSSQTISLSGAGTATNLVVTPTNLGFSSVALDSSSTAQTVILTNIGQTSVSLSSLQVAGDYKQTNNCPAVLNGGSTCTLSVIFTPTVKGSRTGSLTITDNSGSPQTISLSGAGSDFSLAVSTSQDTIQSGATATYTLTASAVGGSFPNAVSLSCSGLPANASCSFSPSSVKPGATKATTTLSITTADSSAENLPPVPARHNPIGNGWLQLQGLGVVGMVLAKGSKRSRKTAILVLLALLIAGMLFMTGCAGGTGIGPQNQPPTTSKSYTITVTGTSGSLQHTLPVTLTIQ
jgi:Beta-propeller repeat/Abnormal spindle-like microcephaly-assoc'd, ASPM-SPD-2-Hydin